MNPFDSLSQLKNAIADSFEGADTTMAAIQAAAIVGGNFYLAEIETVNGIIKILVGAASFSYLAYKAFNERDKWRNRNKEK